MIYLNMLWTYSDLCLFIIMGFEASLKIYIHNVCLHFIEWNSQMLLSKLILCRLLVKSRWCWHISKGYQSGKAENGSFFCCSVAKSCQTLWDPVNCGILGFPVIHYLLEFAQTHIHWVSDAIELVHPLSPPSLAFDLWQHQCLFWCVDPSHQSPKYWSFSISPSNEYSGLISFQIDWFDLLAVQETLKSLLQHHSSKVSILWHSVFFMVQLSHLYMTTRKTISLTIWNFLSKVMSLLFNTPSSLVITILPRIKCLNFVTTVTVHIDFGAQENEIWHCFHSFPICLPWSDEPRFHNLRFLNVEF